MLVDCTDADLLSQALISFVGLPSGVLVAPKTENYFENMPLFLLSIPKSGTHMLIGLLEAMGITRDHSQGYKPGMWSTVAEYNYHAPCKEFLSQEWVDPIGKNAFFRSPAIFMYRNPMDVLASEFSWYQKADMPFSNYLRTFPHEDEKILKLIDDDLALGSIRERIMKYIGWIHFSNVMPVSYEELVGSRGGGSDDEQIKTIWSLQLKLHIPGDPYSFAEAVFNPKSATFNKGTIGNHKAKFKPIHYERYKSLPQDFMEELGYVSGGGWLPKKVDLFRNRPVVVSNIPEESIWQQRLVKESFYGHNIISVGDGYIAIPQGTEGVDLSVRENRTDNNIGHIFNSLPEAMISSSYQFQKSTIIDETLKPYDDTLKSHDDTLKSHDDTLKSYDKVIQRFKKMLEVIRRPVRWFTELNKKLFPGRYSKIARKNEPDNEI